MPNLMLISLMKRSNHLFQPSHDSFAEPKGKRWDVGHRSLFSYQNDFGMGCTCWRTVIGNGHRELRVLSQKSTYRKAGNVHWSYCTGVWVVDGSSSPSACGISDSQTGMGDASFSCGHLLLSPWKICLLLKQFLAWYFHLILVGL